jgi:hypothetical protein
MAVTLDLRRDLPKVSRQLEKVLDAQKGRVCEYTAPCVIGAMVPKGKRLALEYPADFDEDATDIATLIRLGLVEVPAEQRREIIELQATFDKGTPDQLLRKLARLGRKYAAQGIEAGTGETTKIGSTRRAKARSEGCAPNRSEN